MSKPYGLQRRWQGVFRQAYRAVLIAASVLVSATPASAEAPIRLLVFGDSLVAGYGLAQSEGFEAQLSAALKAQGHDVTILDGGLSGDTSAGGRSRLDWVLADKPDAAIVELGANDGLRGTDPTEMALNLNAILDAFAAQHIPVLLEGMLAPPNLGQQYGDAFAAVFARLGQRPGLLYDPFLLAGIAGNPALNQADHIHPNPQGVRIEVMRILPLVDNLLAEARPQRVKTQ